MKKNRFKKVRISDLAQAPGNCNPMIIFTMEEPVDNQWTLLLPEADVQMSPDTPQERGLAPSVPAGETESEIMEFESTESGAGSDDPEETMVAENLPLFTDNGRYIGIKNHDGIYLCLENDGSPHSKEHYRASEYMDLYNHMKYAIHE